MATSKTDIDVAGNHKVYELKAAADGDVEDITIAHGFAFAEDADAKAGIHTSLAAVNAAFYLAKWYVKTIDKTNVVIGKGATDTGCAASGAATARLEILYHSAVA